MADPYTIMAALSLGFVGSTHCIGMCGGIVGILTTHQATPLRYLLGYNLGRILSYSIAGGLVGALGYFSLHGAAPDRGMAFGRIISAIFLILLGLYIAGWRKILYPIERLGGLFWRRLEPVGRRFLPVRHLSHAFCVGLVWGWLPCGMVYSVLAWALVTADPVTGAALMAAFGVGTLPTLMMMGVFSERVNQWTRNPQIRLAAGFLIIVFGAMQLAGHQNTHIHDQHVLPEAYQYTLDPNNFQDLAEFDMEQQAAIFEDYFRVVIAGIAKRPHHFQGNLTIQQHQVAFYIIK